MRRTFSLLLAIALCLTLLAGCSGEPQQPAAGDANTIDDAQDPTGTPAGDTANSQRDTLYVAIQDDIESLSPFEVCTGLSGYAYSILYEKLFTYDIDGNIIPWLVKDYTQTTDVQWDFNLHEGILFHDGTEMTAEDVKASLENAYNWPVPVLHDKTVEVTGKYSFRITTPKPDAFLIEDDLAKSWCAIVPKHLLESGNDFKVNPIGSGPYKFVTRATAESLTFTTFEDYRDLEAYNGRIPNIVFKVIPDASSRTFALENGEVDLVPVVETLDIQRLVENKDTQVLETPGVLMYNLTINTQKPHLDNILVRQAIAYAIDPEAALIVTINGLGYVERGIFPKDFYAYTTDGQADYDPEYAKQLLAEAGYQPGELTFDMIAYNTAMARCAESVQADLAEVGINMTISTLESAVMIERTAAGDFDMILLGNTGINFPYNQLNSLFHTDSIRGPNRCFVSDPEVDAWIDQIPSTMDEDEAKILYENCAVRIQNTYGVLPLFVDYNYTAYRTGMSGVYRVEGGLYLPYIRFE